ncbi:MAG: sigma-70 family RNA polymerase sigma factor [Clostridia bacterium]|nr:sigma-70 family RNA polymerase sigma factor [Clostridia bacterium]
MFGRFESRSSAKRKRRQRLFERLYLSYRRQMYAVAIKILGNEKDAEDAVHDVFVKLAKKHMRTLEAMEDERDLRCYLLKAAKHTALNMKRDRKPLYDPLESPVRAGSRADDEAFLSELYTKMEYRRVKAAIDRLDPVYRDALYYHFVLEMTISQTAELLGRKGPTVKKQLVRGKKLLLDILEKEGGAHRADI